MALFSSNKKNSLNNFNGEEYLISNTIIGQKTIISGPIETAGNIRIDGEVLGNIDCKSKLVVGPQGKIIGKVLTNELDNYGVIDGEVNVTNEVVLRANSKLIGDLTLISVHLEIEDGASFNGKCTMSSNV